MEEMKNMGAMGCRSSWHTHATLCTSHPWQCRAKGWPLLGCQASQWGFVSLTTFFFLFFFMFASKLGSLPCWKWKCVICVVEIFFHNRDERTLYSNCTVLLPGHSFLGLQWTEGCSHSQSGKVKIFFCLLWQCYRMGVLQFKYCLASWFCWLSLFDFPVAVSSISTPKIQKEASKQAVTVKSKQRL